MLWLCSLWKSEEVVGRVGEAGNTRRGQGVLAEPRGAQLRSRGALLGVFGLWSLQVGVSLYFFLFSLCSLLCFTDRERLQRCPVLEWLEGKPKCLTCIFFLLYCLPPNFHTSPCLFLFFFSTFALLFLLFHLYFLPFSSVYCPFPSPSVFTPFVFVSCPFSLFSVVCSFMSQFSAFTAPFSTVFVFFLLSFFFTPLSRATYLSLQDGAVHPWPGLWGHSEKADPKAEGAHTEVYRYGSERTHLHHTKV